MLRLCICDDRKEDIDSVKALIARFSERYPEYPVQASYFDNGYDLLEALQKSGGDVYKRQTHTCIEGSRLELLFNFEGAGSAGRDREELTREKRWEPKMGV